VRVRVRQKESEDQAGPKKVSTIEILKTKADVGTWYDDVQVFVQGQSLMQVDI
jgi:hypothetical protein